MVKTFGQFSNMRLTHNLALIGGGTYWGKVGCSKPKKPETPNGTITVCKNFIPSTYTTSSDGATSYSWTLDPPSAGTILNVGLGVQIVWDTSFVGTAHLAVRGINFCDVGEESDSLQISVFSLPNILASAINNIFCSGQSTTLSASGASNYLWTPSTGLNNDSIANPTAAPIITTTYTVIGTDSNGCTNTATVAITVNQLPTPAVNASGPTIFCSGDTVTLSSSITGTNYLWSNNATTQSISVNMTGNFYVTLTDINGCVGTSLPTSVIVNPLPTPMVNPSGATTFCSGDSVTLSSSVVGINYLWSNNANTQSIAVITTGNYSVTVTDVNGCTGTSIATSVTVNPLPNVSASAVSNDLCYGQSTTLSASGANNYLWIPTNGLSNDSIANPNASPPVTTIYTVTGTDGNGCSKTATVPITVSALPSVDAGNTVTITQGNTTIIGGIPTASGNEPFIYSWTPTTGLDSSNVSNPTASPTDTTTYTVTVIDVNECSNIDSILVIVNLQTGIVESTNEIGLLVFPNPTNDLLNISGSSIENGEYTFELKNVIGETIFVDKLNVSNHSVRKQFSLASLTSGMYFLTIKNGKTKTVAKLHKMN
ncbi:MAG: T9SS type A sorting domain-containing protein [Chitinophagaceae bacterium]|nr:T9SS type A sorting domain-containing protein [Chitinophagaceae bacterium]